MKSNQLWRPSEQVFHLLTECRQKPIAVVEQILERGNGNAQDQPPPIAGKRQAPSVWKPPVAMKPNCPSRQPFDEWQLPQEQPKLPESFFLGVDNGNQEDEEEDRQLARQHEVDESESDQASPQQHQAEFDDSNNNASDEEQLLPLSSSPQNADDPQGSSRSFTLMKQQVVARTALFSGLGSVSFGSAGGFSAPATSTIFTQRISGFGARVQIKDEETQNGHGQLVQERSPKQSSQRPASSGKGSSEYGGGFKPSELHGMSFTNKSPPAEAPAIAPASNASRSKALGRKPRTRPLDHLMNPVPKSKSSPHDQDPEPEAPRTRTSARIRNMIKKRKNLEEQQKQEQGEEGDDDGDEDQGSKRRSSGAYFPHTGAWIAQKKSSRSAKNAFKNQQSEDEFVAVEAPRLKSNGVSSGSSKPVTKKRSLSAMSHVMKPAPSKKRMSEGCSEGDQRRNVGEANASVVARSKRGRVLMWKDSKGKKTSKK